MLNCGLRQHSFQSLPWVAHAGAEHTWHGWGRVWHHSNAAALQGQGTDTGGEHGTRRRQGENVWKREKGKKIGRAVEMRECGHQNGNPITPVFVHKPD